MCAFTACVRFLRRRGPAGLWSLFFGYSVVILRRYFYICERTCRTLPISASRQIDCRTISRGQAACP